MAEFEIVIVRTYETRIKVSADTAAAARRELEAYGLLQACSDYPNSGDDITVERIKSVRKSA